MDNKNFIRYQIFEELAWLEAFTTTKNTLRRNFARFTGDELQVYSDNREELAALLGISAGQLVFPRQTHSNVVRKIDTIPDDEISDTDALVTNKSGLCLCVQTADCVPILLVDTKTRVIAAIHAGWRGTVSKIVTKAIEKLKQDFGSLPLNILAAIGPSIGPNVYEVGPEVVEAARKTVPEAEKTLSLNAVGKYHFNLWEANRRLLLDAGLSEGNIEVLEACSFSENEKYFSARRDGVNTGRMVSGIMLRE
jgi:YfiH family protein